MKDTDIINLSDDSGYRMLLEPSEVAFVNIGESETILHIRLCGGGEQLNINFPTAAMCRKTMDTIAKAKGLSSKLNPTP